MYKYFNRLNTDDGKALPGYQVRLMTTEPEVAVDIFADESGTPIESVSGVANAAITDNGGNYQFFVEPGTYNIVFSSPGGTFLDRIRAVPMLNGPKGDKGDKGDTGGPRAITTLADLKAALTGDDTFIYDSALFKWTTGNYTGQADDINIIKADSTALSVGAWVRQGADGIIYRAPTGVARPANKKLDEITLSIADAGGVQAAVDAALVPVDGQNRPRPFAATALTAVTEPVNLDVIEASRGRARVLGSGNGGGFYTADALNIFETNLTGPVPLSNWVTFQGVHFEADNNDARAMSGQFLRVAARDCEFDRIPLVTSTNYLQEWMVSGARVREVPGVWMSGSYSFGVEISGQTTFFNGGGAVEIDQTAQATLISGVVAQTLTGPVFDAGRVLGGCIVGGYFEHNDNEADIILDRPGRAVSYFNTDPPVPTKGGGFAVIGNAFIPTEERGADPSKSQVKLGAVKCVFSAGNSCGGHLYDTSEQAADDVLISFADHATVLYTGRGTGLLDPAASPVGNVISAEGSVLYSARGAAFVGFDPGFCGLIFNRAGNAALNAFRLMFAPMQTHTPTDWFGTYPFKLGTIILADNPATGGKLGYRVTTSGVGGGPTPVYEEIPFPISKGAAASPEARMAALEARMAALEARVAALEAP